MKILLKLFILLSIISLFSGCSILRRSDKPFLAIEYLHQAEMAGAAEYASEEYQRLLMEFFRLEKLHKARKYKIINKQLPLFAEQAEQLVELTRQNIRKTETLTAASVMTPEAVTPPLPSSSSIVKKDTSIKIENERTAKPRLTYTVSEGELLWAIAKRPDVYGDPLLWPLLYQANRDQIKDPRQIYAGQTLTIPRNTSEEEREKARNLAKKSDIFSPE